MEPVFDDVTGGLVGFGDPSSFGLRREDLRLREGVTRAADGSWQDFHRPVSVACLRTIPGLLELLCACGHCEGTGTVEGDLAVPLPGSATLTQPCAVCDGTGINPHIRRRLLGLLGGEACLTHGSAFYDEGMCGLQMARLYHETGGNNLAGLEWVNKQYGECSWQAVLDALAGSDATP